jgi:hypothetical protein
MHKDIARVLNTEKKDTQGLVGTNVRSPSDWLDYVDVGTPYVGTYVFQNERAKLDDLKNLDYEADPLKVSKRRGT